MTYDSLIKDLKNGREIEFTYKETLYSISNTNGFWYFSILGKNIEESKELSPFDDKKTLIDQVSKIKIGPYLLKEIFDKNLYDDDSLYIY